jgi:ribosomal protein S1
VDHDIDATRDFVADLEEGDELTAFVVSVENDRGQIILSLKQAALDAKWARFEQLRDDEETVQVEAIDTNKGGVIVMFEGVRGFIPSSQVGKHYMGKLDEMVEEEIDVKIIEVEQETNRLIFSERHVSEADEMALRDDALDAVEEGGIYDGVVSGVMPFGLFVTVEIPIHEGEDEPRIGHVEGLVHISEISWKKVDHPKDFHERGDRIQVKVLEVDREDAKLTLSIKRLSDDPWEDVDARYPVGTTFTGTVTRIESFGVFIEAEPGIDGLMHISKIGDEQYEVGQDVTVTVESVSPEKHRMSLGPVMTEVPMGYK